MKHLLITMTFTLGFFISGVNAAEIEKILIQNATVITATDSQILENTDILIDSGLIVGIGSNLVANDAIKIDASNQIITPGLIAPYSQLGLMEIQLERETRDDSTQHFSAGFSIVNAFNPSSTLIPYNRSGGITSAIVGPSSAKTIFSGMASVFKLDSELKTDYIAKDIAITVSIGAGSDSRASQILMLEDTFNKALRFNDSREQYRLLADFDYDDHTVRDLEAILRILNKEIPLIVRSNRAKDLLRIISLGKKYGIKIIFHGAKEAWRIAEILAEAGIPVILDPMDNLPSSFDAIAARMDNAYLLNKAGVKVLITSQETHNSYLSRQGAGNAVAHGLPQNEAIKALTANVAEVFGLSDELGTIEQGKVADLVIWDGNPLEVSSFATVVFIDGKQVSLVLRSTRLRDRYLQKLGLH
jgi:imidazolonepropionase-like amidohydrolase